MLRGHIGKSAHSGHVRTPASIASGIAWKPRTLGNYAVILSTSKHVHTGNASSEAVTPLQTETAVSDISRIAGLPL
jgi:hypothetical protein